MRCFVMQDFVTIRGASNVFTIVQSQAAWLDLEPFQDIIVWLDAKEVSPGSPTNVNISYETSPSSDESLFVAVSGPTTISATGVTVTSLLSGGALANPLARYLRWKLTMTGTAAAWDITFRLLIAANSPGPWRGRMVGAQPTAPVPTSVDGQPSIPVHLADQRMRVIPGLRPVAPINIARGLPHPPAFK